MVIPRGMTEEQVVQIIDGITNRLAGKFKFGYHDLDDMKQQARLFAWEGLENYDGVRPLENFLWTHVRNRLYNFKRNHFGRPDKPCDNCPFFDKTFKNERGYPCRAFENEDECDLYSGWMKRKSTKRNLMNTANLDIDIKQANHMDEFLDQKHIFNMIDQAIPIPYREDWIRFIHNLKLPKARRQKLIDVIRLILKEKNFDTEAW